MTKTIHKTVKKVKASPNFGAYLCLFAVCILWGTTWVVSSYTVRQGVPAMQVVSLRQILGGTLIAVAMLFYHRGKIEIAPWKDTLFLSFINFICSNGISTWGVQYIPAGLASIIGATYPIWVVVIYYFFFNKQVSKQVFFGLMLALLGLIGVFYPSLVNAELKENFLFGLGLSIFSTITWSIGTIYTKNQTQTNVNPYFSMALQMIISGVTITSVLMASDIYVPLHSIKLEVYLGILYLTILGSILAYSCFLYALKNLPAEQVSIYAYINPIVAMILSNIFLGEKITTLLVVGSIIVLIGIYILNKAFRKTSS
jgi:drug/metabolite transporter (DMT)-like permease